jgi:TIR domain
MDWDVFISHASEDKKTVAEPLADALVEAGLRVWYDRYQLRLGDRLLRSISEGLKLSRYGVVILSPTFFDKDWPLQELDGLAQIEQNGRKVILPIWHGMTVSDVRKQSPLLADRVAIRWEDGLAAVVDAIIAVVKSSPHSQPSSDEDAAIRALMRIKKQTKFLWERLAEHAQDRAPFLARIREDTLAAIQPELQYLHEYAELNYTTTHSCTDIASGYAVLELEVTHARPRFWELLTRTIRIDGSEVSAKQP